MYLGSHYYVSREMGKALGEYQVDRYMWVQGLDKDDVQLKLPTCIRN